MSYKTVSFCQFSKYEKSKKILNVKYGDIAIKSILQGTAFCYLLSMGTKT